MFNTNQETKIDTSGTFSEYITIFVNMNPDPVKYIAKIKEFDRQTQVLAGTYSDSPIVKDRTPSTDKMINDWITEKQNVRILSISKMSESHKTTQLPLGASYNAVTVIEHTTIVYYEI